MAHDVFVSYATRDKPTADAICATLEGKGIRCWIAPRDVLPGSNWAESLISAIDESRVFILVFSAGSNTSPQVMREVEHAVGAAIPILPFRIEDIRPSKSMDYFLGPSHWLDAITPPVERHIDRLAETAQLLLASGSGGSPDTANRDEGTPPSAPQSSPSQARRKGRETERGTRSVLPFAMAGAIAALAIGLSILLLFGRASSSGSVSEAGAQRLQLNDSQTGPGTVHVLTPGASAPAQQSQAPASARGGSLPAVATTTAASATDTGSGLGPHATQVAVPAGYTPQGGERYELTLSPGESKPLEFRNGQALIGKVACAQGGVIFSWSVRQPYPAPKPAIELFDEYQDQHQSMGAGSAGKAGIGICHPGTIVNRAQTTLVVEVDYVAVSR